MDRFSKKKRSWIMGRIRNRDTGSELALKRYLDEWGFEYQPRADGNPDFRKGGLLVFVDGCFWHGCPEHYRAPKSNRRYWRSKVRLNMRRDRKTSARLKKASARIVRIWEHELRDMPSVLEKILLKI